MITGIYAASSSMLNGQKAIDVISSNLANVTVPGYKQERVTYHSFPDVLLRTSQMLEKQPRSLGQVGGGAYADRIQTSFVPGQLIRTGNNTDFAVSGDGFFQVLTDRGIHYTRNGTFALDADGFLRTANNGRVLGQNGAVWIGGSDFMVRNDGEIWVRRQHEGVVEEELVDRLEIVDFADREELIRTGNSELALPENSLSQPIPAKGTVSQGYLEQSNLTLMEGMVRMIDAFRAYEASQRVLKAIDETLDKTVTEVASATA